MQIKGFVMEHNLAMNTMTSILFTNKENETSGFCSFKYSIVQPTFVCDDTGA